MILRLCCLMVLFNVEYYMCSDAFSDEWVVEIQAPMEKVHQIINRHGFQYINQVERNVFILKHQKVARNSRSRAIDIYKRMTSEPEVKFLEQQKWNKRSLRTTVGNFKVMDSKWPRMWYLNGASLPDLGVRASWDMGYSGSGVSIAIVDDGVDVDHVDLKSNYDSKLSRDVYARDNDPRPSPGASHGTKCAGVALASKNGVCVIGVAYRASLIAVRLLGPLGATDSMEHDALLVDHVGVFSNSWGAEEKKTFAGPGRLTKAAIKEGINKGRSGLGSIYVWAAGNGGSDDNCNCDGFVNSIYTIGINAVTVKKTPPGYAERCTAVLASTYSGGGGSSDNIVTTDVNQGCVETFTGTSAATPLASGILALVIQKSPQLTWRDMQHLIVNTSDATGLKYGEWQTNGVGRQVSDYYGFGLLSADRLINVGITWKGVPSQHICKSQKVPVNKSIQVRSPSRVVYSTLLSTGCKDTANEIKYLEHVEVEVNFMYSLRGSVQLALVSPSGLTSKLLTRRGEDVDKNSNQIWTYMTVQHWGENPTGNWTVEMSLDMDYAEFGEFVEWSMTMYGTKTDPIHGKDNGQISDWSTTTYGPKNKPSIGGTNGELVDWTMIMYGTKTDPNLGCGNVTCTNVPGDQSRPDHVDNGIPLWELLLIILISVSVCIVLLTCLCKRLCLKYCCKENRNVTHNQVDKLQVSSPNIQTNIQIERSSI